MSRPALIFSILVGLVVGIIFSIEASHVFAVRNSPIVTGHIISRTPIREFSVPRVDFAIQIDDSQNVVHARTQGQLINKVPELVRFRLAGDPSQEVFLFEYEENPYWVVLICWSSALLLSVVLVSTRTRKWLGWL